MSKNSTGSFTDQFFNASREMFENGVRDHGQLLQAVVDMSLRVGASMLEVASGGAINRNTAHRAMSSLLARQVRDATKFVCNQG